MFLLGVKAGVAVNVLMGLFALASVGLAGGWLILSRPHLGIYLLAFLIPFELFQVIPGVNLTVSKLLGGVLLVTLFCHVLRGGIRGIRRTPIDFFLLWFYLACAISLYGVSYFKEGGALLISLVSYGVLFYLSVNMLRTKEHVMGALGSLWLSILLVSILSVFQNHGIGAGSSVSRLTYIGGQLMERHGGTSINTALFATFPLLGFGISLSWLRMARGFFQFAVVIFSLCVFVLCIYESYTRSVLLALFPMALCYGCLFAKRKVLFQIGLVICVAIALASLPGFLYEHFSSGVRLEDPSTSSRYLQVLVGWELFKDHWVFGVGFGNSVYYMLGYEYGYEILENGMHCTPIAFLLETGLFGFLSFCCLLGAFLLNCFKAFNSSDNQEMRLVLAAGVVCLVGHLFHLLFHPAFYMSVIGIFYGIVMAAWCVAYRESKESDTC